MPGIVSLPTRGNSITYSEQQIDEVHDLLTSGEVQRGQGVVVDDEPQPTEGKARNRARIMVDYLMNRHGVEDGMKYRTHTVPTDNTKNAKFYAVVSLAVDNGSNDDEGDES